MGLPSEALVKDFWTAMWEVYYTARHDNVPRSLRDFGKWTTVILKFGLHVMMC